MRKILTNSKINNFYDFSSVPISLLLSGEPTSSKLISCVQFRCWPHKQTNNLGLVAKWNFHPFFLSSPSIGRLIPIPLIRSPTWNWHSHSHWPWAGWLTVRLILALKLLIWFPFPLAALAWHETFGGKSKSNDSQANLLTIYPFSKNESEHLWSSTKSDLVSQWHPRPEWPWPPPRPQQRHTFCLHLPFAGRQCPSPPAPI